MKVQEAANEERPLPDSNRGWRICNPLPFRLAKGPGDETSHVPVWMVAGIGPGVNGCRLQEGNRAARRGVRKTEPVGRVGLELLIRFLEGTEMHSLEPLETV